MSQPTPFIAQPAFGGVSPSFAPASDAYPFDARQMMFVVSKDGQRRAAMPNTSRTFASAFHGRMAWGNGPAGETFPVLNEEEGLAWLTAERAANRKAALNFWRDRPDLQHVASDEVVAAVFDAQAA